MIDNIRVPDFTEANCLNMGTELFFPDSQIQTQAVLPHIKKMCFDCPVFEECLNYALRVKVQGIWAGTTEVVRRQLRAKLGIKPSQISVGEYFVSQTRDAINHRNKRAQEKEQQCLQQS